MCTTEACCASALVHAHDALLAWVGVSLPCNHHSSVCVLYLQWCTHCTMMMAYLILGQAAMQ
jgi:uncharacterized membrane protein SirB2